MATEENQLLREYAATRSQASFARLAQRYVDVVYAAARRQLRGDAHLAEDVTQAVFIILAEKAAKVPADRPLSAWLLKTTAYCAANARRSKTHREHYERRAAQMARANEPAGDDDATWDELSPLLDEGLNKLRPQDRDAVLLKFFEKKSLRQIGDALGISEEAAGKRVARAVDRLRDFFRRRGVAVSAAALPVLLMSNASHAAPAALVSAVAATTAATAATTAATTSGAAAVAKGALAVMAAEKAKALALAAAVLILGVGGGAIVLKTVLSPVSNERRQVAVNPNPVAGAAAPSPAVNNAWAMRLPDGTLVELLGITDEALGRNEWWTLDGSPVPPPADYQPGLVTVPRTPGTRAIQLVMRFVDVPPQAPRLVTVRPNAAGGATATTDRGGARLTYHVTLVDANQEAADLIVGRGSPGNVIELQNISLRPGHNPGLRLVPARRAPAGAAGDVRVSTR